MDCPQKVSNFLGAVYNIKIVALLFLTEITFDVI
jgi:hypothetical protein